MKLAIVSVCISICSIGLFIHFGAYQAIPFQLFIIGMSLYLGLDIRENERRVKEIDKLLEKK